MSLQSRPESAEPLCWGEVLDEIKARRAEFDAARAIAPDIIEKFRVLGVYRAMVSKRFGGEARSPAGFCRMIEAISAADGSAGWVASFGAAATYLACLPMDTLDAIYGQGPDIIFAGGLFPPQTAERVEGGLRVSGRWRFGSGCRGADLIGVGIKIEGDETGGLPRMAVMPAAKIVIEENWDVIGLRGTGSHDLVVDGVVVPQDWTFVRGGAPSLDEPLSRYPAMALAAQVLAVVGLGVARGALAELLAMSSKVSISGGAAMTGRPSVQIEVARIEAQLNAARAWFYEATETVWREALADRAPEVRDVAQLRLAAVHAARTAADAAQSVFRLSGTTGIFESHPLSRHVCDAMVVAQHAFLSEGHLQEAGRLLSGGAPAPGFP